MKPLVRGLFEQVTFKPSCWFLVVMPRGVVADHLDISGVTESSDLASGVSRGTHVLFGPASAIMSGAEQSKSASGASVEAKILTDPATYRAPARRMHIRLNGSYPGGVKPSRKNNETHDDNGDTT